MKRVVAVAMAAAALAVGCGARESVLRVVDGRPVGGEYVPPEAYAAYLRGAIAEASGDHDGAIRGYAEAASLGPADAEPWTRLGLALCLANARGADDAFDRALSLDGSFAPAWSSRAACEAHRAAQVGPSKAAAEDARRALAIDPRETRALLTLARNETAWSATTRDQLVAMSLAAPADLAAWQAVATWAEVHDDAGLAARAYVRIATLAGPATVAAPIRQLAGKGAIPEAQAVARACAASPVTSRSIDPFVARLAIDGALIAGDVDAARRASARGHLPLAVAAARALLLGDAASARTLVEPVLRADPRATDARMVLAAAADAGDDRAAMSVALHDVVGARDPVEPEVWVVYARTVARRASVEAARRMEPLLARGELPSDADDRVTHAVVALAAQGVLDPSVLGANARTELAERRGERAPDDVDARGDDRHRLLAWSRRAPLDPRTRLLAHRLAALRDRDPIVAVAFARLSLAGAPDVPSMTGVLAHLDPADPLVAAAALDLALRAHDAGVIPLARARLGAVARTPAERARLVQ